MVLTGNGSSSDNDDYVRVESKEKTKPTTAGIALNAAKLEEHNRSTGEEVKQLHSLPRNAESVEKTEVPSQVGAGLLFGLSGLLLGGPLLALLGGAGATYVASNDEGPIGDAARASGDFAIDTGSKVGEAAKEANEKHGLIDKIKSAFAFGWGKVQHFDEEHKATEKVKETMSNAGEKTVEFERKHHVMENILGGIQSGVNFLLGKVRDATGESCNGNSKTKQS